MKPGTRSRTGWPGWAAGLFLLLGVLSCNLPLVATPPATPTLPPTPLPPSGHGLSDAIQTPTSPPTLARPITPLPVIPTLPYAAAFEPAECAFPIPVDYSPDCGYLLVPENRARSGSPTIRLHVAVFRSTSPNPAPDPVVHLAGGPGSSSLDLAGYMFTQGVGAVLDQRDLILFDQRGTGFSRPRLDCPERDGITPALLEKGLAEPGAEQAVIDAFARCKERLAAEGIDVTAYNSAASAVDVNDLRLALGLDQINLYGVSYGTRLGLTILRDYPQTVRSAVFDSVYPPQANLYTSLAPNAQRAFDVLLDRCASDPGCSATYPDLPLVFYALVDNLNNHPVTVDLFVGRPWDIRLDGDLLVDVLLVGLYNPNVIAYMPKMIYDIRAGDYEILRERLNLYFDTSTAQGMTMSVQCSEEIPFGSPQEAARLAQNTRPQVAGFFPESIKPLFTVCQNWNPNPPDPRENQPVSSSVPTLLLTGEYDPITPPDWARMAAATLDNSHLYEIPGSGHWVTRSSICSLSMALAFWSDPTRSPNSDCLATTGVVEFVLE